MPVDLALLRTVHVLAAATWFGMAFYQVAVLLPAVRAESEAGPRFMRRVLLQGKQVRWFLIAGWGTVLAGLLLYWRGSFFEAEPSSTYGILLNLGVLLGLTGLAVAMFVTLPAARRMKELVGGKGPPPAEARDELPGLQKRLGMGSHLIVGLLFLTFVVMMLAGRV